MGELGWVGDEVAVVHWLVWVLSVMHLANVLGWHHVAGLSLVEIAVHVGRHSLLLLVLGLLAVKAGRLLGIRPLTC